MSQYVGPNAHHEIVLTSAPWLAWLKTLCLLALSAIGNLSFIHPSSRSEYLIVFLQAEFSEVTHMTRYRFRKQCDQYLRHNSMSNCD